MRILEYRHRVPWARATMRKVLETNASRSVRSAFPRQSAGRVRQGHSPVIPADASRFADTQGDRAGHIPKACAEGSSGNDVERQIGDGKRDAATRSTARDRLKRVVHVARFTERTRRGTERRGAKRREEPDADERDRSPLRVRLGRRSWESESDRIVRCWIIRWNDWRTERYGWQYQPRSPDVLYFHLFSPSFVSLERKRGNSNETIVSVARDDASDVPWCLSDIPMATRWENERTHWWQEKGERDKVRSVEIGIDGILGGEEEKREERERERGKEGDWSTESCRARSS